MNDNQTPAATESTQVKLEPEKKIKLNRAQLRKAIAESRNKQNGHPPKAEWSVKKRQDNAKKRAAQKAARKVNR